MLGAVNRTTFYHLVSNVPFDDGLRVHLSTRAIQRTGKNPLNRQTQRQASLLTIIVLYHKMVDSAANEYMSLVEKTGRLLQTQRIALRLRRLRNEGGDDRTAGTGRTILAFGR